MAESSTPIPVKRVEKSRLSQLPASESDLGFGRHFTDHMFLVEYSDGTGWHDARIVPYAPLVLDPAVMALHYAQQIFEGLKAYHGVDGALRVFRPRKNFERMQRSARRMCMPDVDIDLVLAGMKQLLKLDEAWVPKTEGCSLYIRPNLIATDCYIGVRPSSRYLLYIIMSPVGAYYAQGFNPVSILVESEYIRAAAGGVGEAKTGGNYAASLLGQVKAQMAGFTQVLWLDAKERKYIEEVGTMNIFFVIGDEVITSPLTGTILDGITRASVIELLRHWGRKVTERMFTIDEVVKAAKKGTLKEVFGTGTAAVVSPVGTFSYRDKSYPVGDGKTGPIAKMLYDHMMGLHYGREPDPFGWTVCL